MARLTTDPKDPALTHGVDTKPVPQAEAYLVKDVGDSKYQRPLRFAYTHVGTAGPSHPLRDLTPEESQRYGFGYIKYEEEDDESGTFWTQARLDAVGKGCGASTRMSEQLAATYAVDPYFYGATYCVGCSMHRPVAEFTWDDDGQRVGS